MYLALDIGGTKTLLATVSDEGVIDKTLKIPTSSDYPTFIQQLEEQNDELSLGELKGVGVGVPGTIDREAGIGLAFGNLPWLNVPIKQDLERIFNAPVFIENDANLAGLSEAMLLKDKYSTVLYITISTGIGTGMVTSQRLDATLLDSEPGQMYIEHEGKMTKWESFASGKAITEKFGKYARDIDDSESWKIIANNMAKGFLILIAIIQPEAIVIGGSIGTHFNKYSALLNENLNQYANPQTPVPPILQAQRPEEAVVYGCYDLLNISL